MPKVRIAVQVLNGATGEVREVVAHVPATGEIEAVDLLFARARQDDFYYRFLGLHGIVVPTGVKSAVEYQSQTYFARE